MRAIVGAFRAEVRALLGDGGALLVLVGAVLLYSVFYPIPYRPEVLKEVPLVVVDEDGSGLARRLTELVDAHELLRVTTRATSLAEAEEVVRRGEAGGVLAIPADFERQVRRGEPVSVGVYADASYFLVYRQSLTGALEAIGAVSAGLEIRRLQAGGLSATQARAARDPLPVITRALFNPIEGYATYVVPPVLILVLQQTLLVGMGMLAGTARERRRPLPLGGTALQRVSGRAAVYVLLYTVHAFYYLALVPRLYGFPQRGATLDVVVFTLPFLLSVTLLGLTLEPLFARREASLQLLLFTSLPAVFLAGFSWPVEAMPTWLRCASLLVPSTAGIAGLLRLNTMGATLRQVGFEWLVLWGLTLLYLILACRSDGLVRAQRAPHAPPSATPEPLSLG